MLLGRLRIRGKLTLLVMIPLLATIALFAANSVEFGGQARRVEQTADAVQLARVTGELIRELQLERLYSVGVLTHKVDRSRLSLQNATVLEKQDALKSLGADLPAPMVTAVGQLAALNPIRAAALTGSASVTSIFTGYTTAITALIDGTRLLSAVDGDTTQGREAIALDATMRANEGFSGLLAAMAVVNSPAELVPFTPSAALILPAGTRVLNYATPEQFALFTTTVAAVDERIGENVTLGIVTNPNAALQLKHLPSFDEIYSLTGVGRFVEAKIINDALAAADASVRSETIKAYAAGGLSLGTIIIVVLLSVAVGRSVAVPLRRLTQSADRVARLAESELVRVADDESPDTAPVRLRPVDIGGQDELGELAAAFGRVQETAARLVERQVAGRRNVAQMFGHVGRRTQNLVGRQIALIDKLENEETEPDRLRDLYRLDHVSSRLRRNASSLVVLSGVSGADEHMTPIALGDVVRLALAEIEDYARVDVEVATAVRVAPALINDLVLLLAELMENAATFSPPQTRVVVSAAAVGESARLTIVDRGLGMSAQRLTEENSRLNRRERLDLAPTEVLGLFVVGRLARRHGLRVALRSTDGGGVTVTVEIPAVALTTFGPGAATTATLPTIPALAAAARGATAGVVTSASRVAAARNRTPAPVDAVPAGASPVANVDSAVVNVGALDRATRSLQSIQPWNAFGPPGVAAATVADVRASTSITAAPVAAPPSIPSAPSPSIPSPSIPSPSIASAAPLSANLRRRVPGATLSALDAQTPVARVVDPRPRKQLADAVQVRDSLADFESGVARAMREMESQPEAAVVVEWITDARVNDDRGSNEEGWR